MPLAACKNTLSCMTGLGIQRCLCRAERELYHPPVKDDGEPAQVTACSCPPSQLDGRASGSWRAAEFGVCCVPLYAFGIWRGEASPTRIPAHRTGHACLEPFTTRVRVSPGGVASGGERRGASADDGREAARAGAGPPAPWPGAARAAAPRERCPRQGRGPAGRGRPCPRRCLLRSNHQPSVVSQKLEHVPGDPPMTCPTSLPTRQGRPCQSHVL